VRSSQSSDLAAMNRLAASLPFYNKLTETEKKQLVSNASIYNFAKGACLVEKGESCLGLIHIISGCIRASIISDDGREISLFRVNSGENCVMSASCVMHQLTFETSITTVEQTSVFVVNAIAFSKITNNNIYARCYVYELMTARFSQVMWVMQEILFMRFDQRLAKYLVTHAENTHSQTLKMTQEAIAQEVNSAREVVARMLRQFADDGLVEVRRGCIELKNVDALRAVVQS